MPKVIIAIYSCEKYWNNRVSMIRKTWIQRVPASISILYFKGGAPSKAQVSGNEISLPVGDKYIDLCRKTLAIISYCVENFDFDYLIKVDDDNFVFDTEALIDTCIRGDYVGRRVDSIGDPFYHRLRCDDFPNFEMANEMRRLPYMSGGIYSLSRPFAEWISKQPPESIPELSMPVAPEDSMVGRLFERAKIFSKFESLAMSTRLKTVFKDGAALNGISHTGAGTELFPLLERLTKFRVPCAINLMVARIGTIILQFFGKLKFQ